MYKSPYDILGVSPDASNDEIKTAYRKLAKNYHPDLNNGSAEAETKMREINQAYTELIKNKNSNHQNDDINNQNPYRGYYYPFGNSQSSSSYSDFEDRFKRYTGQYSQSTNDPNLQVAENAILSGRDSEAIDILDRISSRTAHWHYLYAMANNNLGNRITALEQARIAVQLEPKSHVYRSFLNSLQYGSRQYETTRREFGFDKVLCQNPCVSCLSLNIFCNCCLRRNICC